MTSEFKIEKNIERPKWSHGRSRKYPFSQMQVGDSFFVPVDDDNGKQKIGASVRNAALAAVKRGASKGRFSSRQVEGGVRVWRIE